MRKLGKAEALSERRMLKMKGKSASTSQHTHNKQTYNKVNGTLVNHTSVSSLLLMLQLLQKSKLTKVPKALC